MPFFIHFRHSVVSFIKTAHTIILWKWLVVHPFQMMKLTILPTTCILSILYTSFALIRFWMVLTYVSQQYTDAHSMELTFLRSNYVHIQWHKLVVSRLLCELMTNLLEFDCKQLNADWDGNSTPNGKKCENWFSFQRPYLARSYVPESKFCQMQNHQNRFAFRENVYRMQKMCRWNELAWVHGFSGRPTSFSIHCNRTRTFSNHGEFKYNYFYRNIQIRLKLPNRYDFVNSLQCIELYKFKAYNEGKYIETHVQAIGLQESERCQSAKLSWVVLASGEIHYFSSLC